MRSIWRVFRFEYLRHVLTRRFLLVLLSPFLMGLLGLIAILVLVLVQYDRRPIGYIDRAGFIADGLPANSPRNTIYPPLQRIRYADEESALADLRAKKIQVFFVVEEDYLLSGKVRQVSHHAPGQYVTTQFSSFLRANLLRSQPAIIQARLLQAPMVNVRSSSGQRQASLAQVFKFLLPLVGGVLLLIAVNTSGGYLVQSMADEKENRTMEIVVTSISPNQLMTGKIAGNMLVGVTELGVWLMFAVVGLIGVRLLLPGYRLDIDWNVILVMGLAIIPGFIMVSALMAAIGAGGADRREASQIAGFVTLPLAVPFWLINPLMSSPNSPLAVGLSLFPLSAPITLPLRVAFSEVPAWQIALSIGLLCAVAAGSIWFAGRVFRLGMLRYGKPLKLKELLHQIRLRG